MNRTKLKTYAPQARRDFIRAMTDRAAIYGLTATKIQPVTVQGDVALIGGKAFPGSVAQKRHRLEERVERDGFNQTMEAMAYTWFNRLVAMRYMELHGYLDHGYRVLSHPEGKPTPEIVEHAEHVDLPGLDRDEVINLKLDGTKEVELYRKLLIAQCNALHAAMPFLFERIADETELLLPDSLLHSDSLVRKLVSEIDEADWQAVEIIGWLYQFYISEKKDEVIGSVVKSEDIPAATQLFTPNWIVKYLVQNSLGRQWLATYPDSPLKAKMEFYIEPAEQTPEVQAQLKAMTPESLNPEELTFLDPACGSGHILVEAYSLLRDIYLERGYRLRDIPKLILTKNLFGLEIDDRAAQLAAFALLMIARADDRNILSSGVTLNVLAIQQTDHLDTESLLQAFSHTKLPAKSQPTGGEFGFMDEVRAPLYTNAPAPTPAADPLVADLRQLLGFFKNAKTFGSLLQVPSVLAATFPAICERIEALQQQADLTTPSLLMLAQLIRQGELLSQQYECVVANPPYIGNKSLPQALRKFAAANFPAGRADLFAVFVHRLSNFARDHTHIGVMTPFTWMSISAYEDFREWILSHHTICSLIQPEYHAFFESAYVPICTFVLVKRALHLSGQFINLSAFYGEDLQPLKTIEAIRDPQCKWKHLACSEDFRKIPGSPIAYWASPKLISAFEESAPLSARATPRVGMITCNNTRFLRYWYEVAFPKVGLGFADRSAAQASKTKWFPYQKGGAFRRWYGNMEYVVNWENDGHELRTTTDHTGKVPAHAFNDDYIFKPNVNWSKITSGDFSARLNDVGNLFDDAGSGAFGPVREIELLAGFLNSKVASAILRMMNPTLNVQAWNVGTLPIKRMIDQLAADVTGRVRTLVQIARDDWKSNETFWEYERDKLMLNSTPLIRSAMAACSEWFRKQTAEAVEQETEINRLFLNAYNLAEEMSPSVSPDSVPVQRPTPEQAIQRLLSYSVGCAMGRYSLDKPGLIYANSGNEGFDPAAYATFPADKDGIIPVTEEHWFPDDAAARFEEFVGKAWPAEHLDENLAFVAEGLGAKASESPRQTIRRYLSDGFYKHHLQTYKRRPIYWLFTSGKQRAFQALVYLHRYNEGTLSRMRTEYVIPLQGKIAARIEQLEGDKPSATSTSHRRKIEKEQDALRKQQQELQAFDEKLRHYADQRITLDLDDGVKVNYAKFGDLLAEVKAVCGKADEE